MYRHQRRHQRINTRSEAKKKKTQKKHTKKTQKKNTKKKNQHQISLVDGFHACNASVEFLRSESSKTKVRNSKWKKLKLLFWWYKLVYWWRDVVVNLFLRFCVFRVSLFYFIFNLFLFWKTFSYLHACVLLVSPSVAITP